MVVDDTIIRISQSIISGSVKTRVPGTRVASARRQDRIKADDSKRVRSRARNNFSTMSPLDRSVSRGLVVRARNGSETAPKVPPGAENASELSLSRRDDGR